MKKVLSIVLVIIILFSMVGCRKMEEGEVRNESTVEDFAEAAGVSLEFAQSLNDAVGQIHEKFKGGHDMNFKKVIIPTVEDYEALVDILEDAGYDSDYIPSEGTWYEVYDDAEGNNTIISEEKLIMLTNSMENLLTIGE